MTKSRFLNKATSLWSMVYGLWSNRRVRTIDHRPSAIDLYAFCLLLILCFGICHLIAFAQDPDLEFTLDVTANTIPLPNIFKPSIDLSGRGFYPDASWPQTLAANEVLSVWEKEIGFSGIYRMQYNLWEIQALAKDKNLQERLLGNYETIIKKISDSGGTVILDIFGTPAGLGKVLDRTSAPVNLKAFKELVKSHIRTLSCNKRYNIWYEVWSAPDLDNFFLGREQEYLNLYRVVAEAIEELKRETKIHIPVGGPAVSWWYQNLEGNTIVTPEKGLIYELIKFCSRYRLPLDFISWYAYSTDPKAESEITAYNKIAPVLIRDWLAYFNFDPNTPLVISEWNYDSGDNVLPERHQHSFIASSYILSRLKNMLDAGLNYQFYFSLEDFQNNKEGINRNTGAFWFDAAKSEYRGGHKSIYSIFKMLKSLGSNMFLTSLNPNERFIGVIATKAQDYIAVIIYNYINPDITTDYLSRNIASVNAKDRKILLGYAKSEKLGKIINRQIDISRLRGATHKLKNLLKKAQELNDDAKKFKVSDRNLKLNIKNLKDDYLYQRYSIDSSCGINCELVPFEEKPINAQEPYQGILVLKPYSVNMVVLKTKPKEETAAAVP